MSVARTPVLVVRLPRACCRQANNCCLLLHSSKQCLIVSRMIKSVKHIGLKLFFTTGSTAGVQTAHKARLEERLTALHTALSVEDMNIPGWRLHGFKGEREEQWAIYLSGNWRIVFEFRDSHAYLVNYEDCH